MAKVDRGDGFEPQAEAGTRALERGRASYARKQWEEAYEALAHVHAQAPLGAEDLERLAWAAALTGRDPELLGTLEQLYQALLSAGSTRRAAYAAFWLGFRLYALGETGRAGGWLGRAERLVEAEEGECAERGYLMLPAIHRDLASGNLEAADAGARQAAEIGARCEEADLLALARLFQGRVRIQQGRVAEGLALLDEAMLSVSSGELAPIVTGIIYCDVITTCHRIYALDRAREWTAALADWCEKQPQLVTFTGSCQVHRAEVMQLGGAWTDAIEEARRAADRFKDAVDPEVVGDAYYQQAEVYRLRGELAAAEAAYRNASRYGREPQPGLALLRLAEGRPDTATSALRRVLAATTEPLRRVPYLPAFVEISLAAGEGEEAERACAELEEHAERLGTEVLEAIAAHARGAVRLGAGDARGALEPLQRAYDVWRQMGAPYIAARIRVLRGRACRALGDEDGAQLELEAAAQVFEELGAAPEIAGVDGPDQAAPADDTHGLTGRELEVLRLVAAGKTNAVVARELFVSVKTVDRHVSNIFTKLGVSSRAAATSFAHRHGLL